MLIGVETWTQLLFNDSIRVGRLRFQNTIFGHVAQGAAKTKTRRMDDIVTLVAPRDNWRDDLKQIFEYEPQASEEQEFAQNLFDAHAKRLPNGMWETPLILTYEKELGDSFGICAKRNARVLGKLTPAEAEQVINLLKAQRDAKIITVVDDDREGAYFNPIVLVWKKSLTSPLRICFDGSQNSSSGVSGNDLQLAGPPLQPLVIGQLLKFRKSTTAIIADLAQMYLNISVRPEDRRFQRSVINFPGRPVQVIEYQRVFFGSKCSPFLAQAVIKKVAERVQHTHPLAFTVLMASCYIDDLSFSVPSIEIGIDTLRELYEVLMDAHFEMYKVASNVPDVLRELPERCKLSVLDSNNVTKVLGVQWDRDADTLFISVSIPPLQKITKRVAVSTVAKIYDPMGMISPAVMPAKIIIQELWALDRHLKSTDLNASWDRVVPDEIAERFKQWYAGLENCERIRINRHLGFDATKRQELYIFCDASAKAYGAVAYLRSFEEDHVVFRLIGPKAKVAPMIKDRKEGVIEPMSIPRLELMAALVGAELFDKIRQAWGLDNQFPLCMFTDSEIVLARISGSVVVRDVFSENRLRIIRKLTERRHWFHVPTASNPADFLSRGCDPGDLEGMWMNGPELMRSEAFVPNNKFDKNVEVINVVVQERESFPFLAQSVSFRRSVKIMAWILRIIGSNRAGKPKQLRLKREELGSASIKILKIVQTQFYPEELQCIREQAIIKHGPLRTHNPFLDSNEILRIATRIQLEEFDYNERNPIVLPQISARDTEYHLSYQAIHDSHIDTNHGTISMTMAHVRQRFFIPGLRAGVRRFIVNCQKCQIIAAKAKTQIMGNIPKESVLRNPAFYHVSIDFAGPLSMSQPIRRSTRKVTDDEVERVVFDKCWILIVACRSTGAYHFEVVASMEAISVLSAFETFIATRGYPGSVRSDNQSSFHRAKNMLKAVYARYLTSLSDG